MEPERWYYWCDKLGVLVWQDMPSGNNGTDESKRQFEMELLRMIEGHRNHPSIMMWVLFNESWGQYDTERLARWIQELDPSRLVDSASGWTDKHVGDVVDMYHPATNETALEWLELHNQMAVNVDLSGWSISGGINYSFPEGTVITGNGYLVVALSPSDLQNATGITNVVGPYSGRLSNSGDTLNLRNKNKRVMSNAVATITITNTVAVTSQYVVINEWMADNSGPGGVLDPDGNLYSDWLELYNPNTISVDLSGCYMTDSLDTPTKWQIPANTTIAPQGYLLIWADKLTNLNTTVTNSALHANFKLSKSGSDLGLYASDKTPWHTLTFGAQYQNVSQGFYPDGNTNTQVFMCN